MEGEFKEILRANSLYHIYESNAEDGNVVALRGLSISMEEAEAVAVVGPSGSGKSTLLKCLGGLMKPSAGSVELGGTRMTRLTGAELVELRHAARTELIVQCGKARAVSRTLRRYHLVRTALREVLEQ